MWPSQHEAPGYVPSINWTWWHTPVTPASVHEKLEASLGYVRLSQQKGMEERRERKTDFRISRPFVCPFSPFLVLWKAQNCNFFPTFIFIIEYSFCPERWDSLWGEAGHTVFTVPAHSAPSGV